MLIALSLTAVLLTFLFSFLVETAKIEKKLDAARMCISTRGHLQTRLQTIFTSLDHSAFYTKTFEKEKSLSLVLSFDNGIDPEPDFSGPILGRIFLDPEHNLCLASWPATEEKTRPWRTEILQKNVSSFEFDFLGPNTAPEHGVKEKILPIDANLAWRSHWPKSLGKAPAIIRLTIYEEGKKDPVQYAFTLPISECITYQGKDAI
ncbi:MAG: hypothetical protein K1X28_04660 [Parachlamydiales bacterium]|nr:hypothetical protein [Parachlamydiales bacterium]